MMLTNEERTGFEILKAETLVRVGDLVAEEMIAWGKEIQGITDPEKILSHVSNAEEFMSRIRASLANTATSLRTRN